MEQGWDPEVKKHFRKIINSFSLGFIWLMSVVTTGLYWKLAYRDDISRVYIILFYVAFVASLALLIRYYYHTWKK